MGSFSADCSLILLSKSDIHFIEIHHSHHNNTIHEATTLRKSYNKKSEIIISLSISAAIPKVSNLSLIRFGTLRPLEVCVESFTVVSAMGYQSIIWPQTEIYKGRSSSRNKSFRNWVRRVRSAGRTRYGSARGNDWIASERRLCRLVYLGKLTTSAIRRTL